VNEQGAAQAAPQATSRRRHRDAPERDGAAAAVPASPLTALSSAAQVLQQGHAWLRFPAELEAQFRADTLAPRRKMLMLCGVIGIVAICVGSLNLPQLMPDAPEVAMRYLYWIMALTMLGLLLVWAVPPRWRRTWQAEAMTVGPILLVNVGVILDCMVTRADTMFTHSAALVSTLMYGCIAARLRFAWSLGSAVFSFVAYVTFVRGSTPQQELIVSTTAALMALSYAFALVANYAFEYSERRNWLLRQVERQQRQALEDTAARLHRMSIEDPLTQLANRRHFDAELGLAWSRATFTKEPVAMLMVDVDFFKRYNDNHGHPAGDACLIQVAKVLAQFAQAQGGVAGRLGGEEFGLLLPHCPLAQALDVGSALCEAVRAAGMVHRASDVAGHVTVSVGTAQVWPARCPGAGTQWLLDLADQALYQAKASGRNQACAAASQGPNADVLGETREAPAGRPSDQPTQRSEPGKASTKPGTGAEVIALPTSAEAALTQTLVGGFFKLRFPAEQEVAFREHNADQRRQHLVAMAVLGQIIYNLFMLRHRAMFSDIPQGVLWSLAGLAVLMLALTVLIYRIRMPVRWLEGIYSAGTAIMGVGSAWFLSQSDLTTALAMSVSLALIPMFSGVAARQPFWFTCVPALVTCMAAALLLEAHGAQQALILADSVTMIATNTFFTLILSYTLEHGTRKAWLLSRIEQLQGEALQAATRSLHELSMRDPLTGIPNRRQFEVDLERIWTDGLASRRQVALLIIDVDFFKRYNDGYGHPEGDRCLQRVAAAIQEAARADQGLAARLGGEEFGVLLPGASSAQAEQVGERIGAAVRALGLEHRYSQVPGQDIVTISAGAVGMAADAHHEPSRLLAFADDALYRAKQAGRNRVVALNLPSQPPQSVPGLESASA